MTQLDDHKEDIVLVSTYAKQLKKLREEKAKKTNAVVEQFSNISTVRQLDEAIIIQWILEVSDLTKDVVLNAKKSLTLSLHGSCMHMELQPACF